ncbi:helix-turn-helix domain-containing protein [Microvirga sp. 2TAF3]|uniref:helix-turn-helix domain-containing protein n=1 Tax=Microvirga sp. 2TAF3 TaxID=3233014 RepID=UPI003F9D25D9
MSFSVATTGRMESLAELFTSRATDSCHPGQAIFWEGDPATGTFRIHEGVLRLYRILPDGCRAVTGFAFAGDVLGIAFHDRYSYTAEAVTNVRYSRFSRERLRKLASESPALQHELFEVVADELSAAQEQMILLGQKSSEERVASFLLKNGLRVYGSDKKTIDFELPMTRLDMADYLGLTIETVCRSLTKLKQAKLVSFRGRHRVTLHKLAELARFAGEEELEILRDPDHHDPVVRSEPMPLPFQNDKSGRMHLVI